MLNAVKRNKKRLVITLRGEPIAEVVHIGWRNDEGAARVLGAQAHTTKIVGEIVDTDFGEEWEALR